MVRLLDSLGSLAGIQPTAAHSWLPEECPFSSGVMDYNYAVFWHVPQGGAGIDRLSVADADEARCTCSERHPGAILAAFKKTQFTPDQVNQVFIDWLNSVV